MFASLDEASPRTRSASAATARRCRLHAKIKVRMPAGRFPADQLPAPDCDSDGHAAEHRAARVRHATARPQVLVETTLGRLLFNEAFPDDFPFVDRVDEEARRHRGRRRARRDATTRRSWPTSLDKLKDLGFEWSTRAGLTISISDVTTPPAKAGLLEQFEGEAAKVESQYDRGIITDDERRQKEIEIWTDATNQVTKAMQDHAAQSTQFNPIDMMVGSGARGNVMQVRQIAGMRGLVANPRGEIIPRPIKSQLP